MALRSPDAPLPFTSPATSDSALASLIPGSRVRLGRNEAASSQGGAIPPARRARRPPTARRRAAPGRGAAARGGAGRAGATGMMFQHLDYTSQSMDEIKRFYTELLGFTKFNHMTGEMNYLRVETGPSSSLGFMPPMEVAPEQWRPPREPNLYLIVKDVDDAYRPIEAHSVTLVYPTQNHPCGL